jgi:hypothetical protein
MVTHAVSALVVHWQSRLVAIRIAPEPPPAENGVPSTFTVTAHLLDEGAVIDSVSVDEPHASWSSTARASVSATARKDRLRWTTVATVIGVCRLEQRPSAALAGSGVSAGRKLCAEELAFINAEWPWQWLSSAIRPAGQSGYSTAHCDAHRPPLAGLAVVSSFAVRCSLFAVRGSRFAGTERARVRAIRS